MKHPKREPRPDAPSREDYLRAKCFRDMLRKSPSLTDRQRVELWDQATHGDLEGAMRAYEKLLNVAAL